MKADADRELHAGGRRQGDHALLHFHRRVAGGLPVAEHHHDLVAYGLDHLALVLRDDCTELVQAGLDRFRRGLVAEQLVERSAAAHVGKENRAFLGDQRHRNRLSFSGTHSNAWACCILVKYPLFSLGLPRPPAESSMTANIKVAERKCYINGQFVGSGRQFAKINPVDGTVVAQVHEADRAMVDAAVRAARAALQGPWGRMALQARVDLLRKVAEGIEKRFDDFVQAEVADTGKPVSLASHLDIPRGAANFRVFADIVRTYGTESYHLDTPDGKGAVNYALRKPLGVVGVIAPWNLPLLLLTWKLAPALACGNTIVAKPSEETPSTATLLAEVMHEAGVPAGVYNVEHGAVDFQAAPREGALLLRAREERGRQGRHRRGRPEVRRCTRLRRLDPADALDRAARDCAHRARGDFRPLRPYRALRPRGRSDRRGERHALRPRLHGLDHQPRARPPRRAGDGSRHLLGQLLVPARPAHALRRGQALGDWARRRPALAQFLFRADQHLHQTVSAAPPC